VRAAASRQPFLLPAGASRFPRCSLAPADRNQGRDFRFGEKSDGRGKPSGFAPAASGLRVHLVLKQALKEFPRDVISLNSSLFSK
jgi:hypothetical protein